MQIFGVDGPQVHQIGACPSHGGIGTVGVTAHEHRVNGVQILFDLLRQAGVFTAVRPLKRMREEKQLKQNDRKREQVGVGARLACPQYHFGRHITGCAANAEIVTVRRYIVVIADQHIAGLFVNEEVARTQILIAESLSM